MKPTKTLFLILFSLLFPLTAGASTSVRLTKNTGYLYLNYSEIEITGTGGPNTRLYIAHAGTVTLRDVNITCIDAKRRFTLEERPQSNHQIILNNVSE